MTNKTNGASTTYTLTFSSNTVELANNDILYITFPSNVILPSNAVCGTLTGFSFISCTNSGQNLIVKMSGLS